MAVDLPADQLQQLLRDATSALNRGDYRELDSLCRQIITLDSGQADAWFFLSLIAATQRKVSIALQLTEKALSLAGPNAEYLSQKARLLSRLNQRAAALAAADQASGLQPQSAAVLDTLGVVYSHLGEHHRAVQAFTAAVSLKPENPQYQFNLGSAQQFIGNLTEAACCYEQAVRLRPDFFRAHWALSELEKNASDTRRLDSLLQHWQPGSERLKPEDELYLGHAISREFEKLGDHDNAFHYLRAGKQRRREQVNYSRTQDAGLFAAIKQHFPLGSSIKNATGKGEHAVFIVGMPRSGTTLVERILDSHSGIAALGELQDFARAVKAVSATPSNVVLDEQVISAACHADPDEIGARYLASVAGLHPEPGYFIDKMPLNFLYLGFILASLPKAKVICVHRNPLDTCLSNFRQLFAVNFSYYNYHYDLLDTASYYAEFAKLMEHWQSLFGDRIYQLHYEELTADPENRVRGLLEYLNLPWEPDCLNFHQSRRAVSTASSTQVREPVYQTAVGRWRRYEKHLDDVKRLLDEKAIRYE
ncbi:MAG: sulfotransferase [Pseudohongiellaceae bacterium]